MTIPFPVAASGSAFRAFFQGRNRLIFARLAPRRTFATPCRGSNISVINRTSPAAFAVVGFSVVVQGLTMGPLLKRLGLV
jgi:NhaP-type Na+/H+ or K+/H+ antiporter